MAQHRPREQIFKMIERIIIIGLLLLLYTPPPPKKVCAPLLRYVLFNIVYRRYEDEQGREVDEKGRGKKRIYY